LAVNAPKRLIFALALFLSTSTAGFAQAPAPAKKQGINDVLTYISSAWTTLARTNEDCKTFVDRRKQVGKPLLYFPADQPLPPLAADLAKRCNMEVKQLPKPITGPGQFNPKSLSRPGILFLPHPYIVPGGFFNEMYGWDSYFIIRGLLRAGKIDMARGQVENFFYEIEHYGAVLNANRTYFLTRSQPPFLSEMVMAINRAEKEASGQDDKGWLEEAYPYIVRDWQMWTSGEHLAGNTGLSRYYDYGTGPTLDLAETGDPYFAEMITGLLVNNLHTDYIAKDGHSSGPAYTVSICVDKARKPCAKPGRVLLTDDYYKGDASMRESGFDVSSRFGPYSGHTHHYAAVGLNSLLYQTERNLAAIATIVGKSEIAKEWEARAQHRSELMNKYFWNAEKGMYFDYDFIAGNQSDYQYATTLYPLWVGQASPEQAKALIGNLKVFEQPGGIVMSPYDTKLQWDFPYGWAPINLIDIEGLRAYGDNADANRLSYKFLSMVVSNFRRDGTIREKYNVVTRSDEMNVAVGYHVNVVGFGWTNGTFLALLHELPPAQRQALEENKPWTVVAGAP
jgi:alpha,alpha-trehalase